MRNTIVFRARYPAHIEFTTPHYSRDVCMHRRLPFPPIQSALVLACTLAAGATLTLAIADTETYAEVQQSNADGKPHFPAANRKTNRLYVSDVGAGGVLANARSPTPRSARRYRGRKARPLSRGYNRPSHRADTRDG